ncbi:MAG: hypothetical protein GXP01_06935 [Alphaproteobacteria bacterium]|nr:hypothetical protein [Alphaproteobacteria bacterium]
MTISRFRPLIMLLLLFLAGCAGLDTGPSAYAPLTAATPGAASVTPPPEFAATTILDFLSTDATALMSDKEKTEAASAQYFALQFGRPGAPRRWQGDVGASGNVTVGPFVRVNDLDCRDFSHVVAIEGQEFINSGTACREESGQWQVVATN